MPSPRTSSAAATLGHSPDAIAVTNWALGGTITALAGALVAPITFLQPTPLSLLIVPALAAGLVAGFSSFPIALGGALAIGIAESLLGRYVGNPGWVASVPFLVVIVVLVIRGRGLPLRSQVLDRLPIVGSGKVRPVTVGVLFAVMSVLMLVLLPVRWVDAFSVTSVFAILCMSVVVVTGLAGQLSLGQFVIAGVGALVAAKLAAEWGWPFPGPARIDGRDDAARRCRGAAGTPDTRHQPRHRHVRLGHGHLHAGAQQLGLHRRRHGHRVESPSFFGWDISPLRHQERYGFIIIVFLFASALVICNIRRGAAGRRLIAVR